MKLERCVFQKVFFRKGNFTPVLTLNSPHYALFCMIVQIVPMCSIQYHSWHMSCSIDQIPYNTEAWTAGRTFWKAPMHVSQ